jgi:NADP-dependent 3-hydroxy acid dehydrogenase YdfG
MDRSGFAQSTTFNPYSMSLHGKTVLITGASKGIGRELARQLAQQQVNLGLVARNADELRSLQAETTQLGAPTEIFAGDVADEILAGAVVHTLQQRFGRLDILVNNAGSGIFKPADQISANEWDQLMNTNVKGTFLFSRAVIPLMKAQGGGHLVMIASDVARRVFDGGSLYCASKYAQDAFSMALRKELRPHQIKVSVVYSGLVDTHFHVHPPGDPKAQDWLRASDIVQAILYILTAPAHVVIDELMIHPLSQEY